ncbi:MAG: DUF1684 domain-containing protein [Chloroflexota bacterium]
MGDDLERSVEAWRAQRYAALRRPMSWLTLVGLDWLSPGTNRVGSGADNEIVLPGGPTLAGTIELDGTDAVATSEPDGQLRVDGMPVDGLALVTDVEATEERPPTTLEIGSLRLRLIRRGAGGARLGLRTWDTASVQPDFAGIDHWPVDPRWAIAARLDPAPDGSTVAVPDVLGDVIEERTPGAVRFEVDGMACRIDAVVGGDAGELWLIFGDATSGTETYGGGRFLYTSPPHADGTVIVDFNRAYNPPCVFSPYATCPLPPSQNRLPVRIEAGERTYPG